MQARTDARALARSAWTEKLQGRTDDRVLIRSAYTKKAQVRSDPRGLLGAEEISCPQIVFFLSPTCVHWTVSTRGRTVSEELTRRSWTDPAQEWTDHRGLLGAVAIN